MTKRKFKEQLQAEKKEFEESELGQAHKHIDELKKQLQQERLITIELRSEVGRLGVIIGEEREKAKKYRDRYTMIKSKAAPALRELLQALEM